MKPKKNNPPKPRRRRACRAAAQPGRACPPKPRRRRADCGPWRVDRPAPPLPSLYLPRKGREDISVPSVSSGSISAAINYDRRYNPQTAPSNYHPLSANITSRAPSADRPPQTLDRGPQLRTARRAVAERRRACHAVAERRRVDSGFASFRVFSGHIRPQTLDCGPRTADRGLWTVDCGLRTAVRFCTISALFSPHFLASAFHNSLRLNRFRICPSPHGAIPRRIPSHASVVPFLLVECGTFRRFGPPLLHSGELSRPRLGCSSAQITPSFTHPEGQTKVAAAKPVVRAQVSVVL